MDEKKKALEIWLNKIIEESQTMSLTFSDSMVSLGIGIAIGTICKNYKELEDIIDDN